MKNESEELIKQNRELANALFDMYNQYCGEMGHCFMSAGERASSALELYGYADFDAAGRITWENKQLLNEAG